MFIQKEDRVGTMYLEFQFCDTNYNLFKKIKHWNDNSIFISYDDFKKLFSKIDFGYNIDCFGINYFSVEQAIVVLDKLKVIENDELKPFILFLNKVIKDYKGFYILGI